MILEKRLTLSNEIRLQKFLAEAGVASRRASEKLILEGKVKVNGNTVTELGVKIDPEKDKVSVDGKDIQKEDKKYILLNKPKGYVCTARDFHNEKKVFDLIDVNERLHTVGRLDKDTEGLIILTNDGELTQKLTHPSHQVNKVYFVTVKGYITDKEIKKLEDGVYIKEDDGTKVLTSKSKLELKSRSQRTSSFLLTIHEGHKRQVRKMCLAVRHPVLELKRVQEGQLTLDGLKKGEWRYLTPKEVKELKNG